MQPSPQQTACSVSLGPLRPQSGTYALILFSTTHHTLQIGRLGSLVLETGFYVYIGSAFGPGGVRARLAHHGGRARRPHWHIDYVRAVVPLSEIWYTYDPGRREHDWALALQHTGRVSIPLARFGASDCLCAAHFFACARRPSWRAFRRCVQHTCQAHAPLYRYQLSHTPPLPDNRTPYGKRLQA